MKIIVYIGIVWFACVGVIVHSYTCTAAGRFLDETNSSCSNYILCVSSSDGTFLQYNYTCPTTSIFNNSTGLCTDSANYTCPLTNTTDSTSNCTEDGYIADPTSTNCSTYIQCVEINSTFTETVYTCPDSTYFNPNTTLCESDYNCTTTTAFNCTSAGRFADDTVSGCKYYWYCVYVSSTDSYAQYYYECPTTSVFNPSTSVCTTTYTCTT